MDGWGNLLRLLVGAEAGRAAIREILKITQGDSPVCNTPIVRANRGCPWNRQVAIHPWPGGASTIHAVETDRTR